MCDLFDQEDKIEEFKGPILGTTVAGRLNGGRPTSLSSMTPTTHILTTPHSQQNQGRRRRHSNNGENNYSYFNWWDPRFYWYGIHDLYRPMLIVDDSDDAEMTEIRQKQDDVQKQLYILNSEKSLLLNQIVIVALVMVIFYLVYSKK